MIENKLSSAIRDIFRPRGRFNVIQIRDGKVIDVWDDFNVVTDEGLNYLLNAGLNGATQIDPWYVSLFESNYTPVGTETGGTLGGLLTECQAYDETTRPAYDGATSSAQSVTNSASRAEFTINATKTVYGAILSSGNTKGVYTGSTVLALAKFSVARAVVDNDILLVAYTINAA